MNLKLNVHKAYRLEEWNNNKWTSGMPIKNVTFIKSNESSNHEDESPRRVQLDCCVRININFFSKPIINILFIQSCFYVFIDETLITQPIRVRK